MSLDIVYAYMESHPDDPFGDTEEILSWANGELTTLREQVKVLRKALDDSCETIQAHLNNMPTYTPDGWGIERFDPDGEYCGFELINPDHIIQGFHELAIKTTASIRAALDQTNPKEVE